MDAIDQNLARIRQSVDSALRRRIGVVPGDALAAVLPPSTTASEGAGTPGLSPGPGIGQTTQMPPRAGLIPQDVSSHSPNPPPTDLAVEPVSLHRRIWAWIKRIVPMTHRSKNHAE